MSSAAGCGLSKRAYRRRSRGTLRSEGLKLRRLDLFPFLWEVTLSKELLSAIDTQVDTKARSAFIEEATWAYLRTKQRDIRDRKELQAINLHSEELNEEALDVLDYQVDE